jgi:hypothetical protein
MSSIFATVDTDNINDVELKGLSLRAGDKILKLKLIEVENLDSIDEIKREYKHILNQKLASIKDNIQKKVADMVSFVQTYREEYERKEIELKRKLESSQIMPQVSFQQAERGLSISPGNKKGEIYWYIRSIYWPKFVDQKPIETKFQKKLITPIVILVSTEGDNVKSVSTRTPIGLRFFSHYHQAQPDCWGKWKWKPKWNSAEDILTIAKEVEGVLENVNTGSIANRTPIGLPTIHILNKHLIQRKELKRDVDTTNVRAGISNTQSIELEDSWTT